MGLSLINHSFLGYPHLWKPPNHVKNPMNRNPMVGPCHPCYPNFDATRNFVGCSSNISWPGQLDCNAHFSADTMADLYYPLRTINSNSSFISILSQQVAMNLFDEVGQNHDQWWSMICWKILSPLWFSHWNLGNLPLLCLIARRYPHLIHSNWIVHSKPSMFGYPPF